VNPDLSYSHRKLTSPSTIGISPEYFKSQHSLTMAENEHEELVDYDEEEVSVEEYLSESSMTLSFIPSRSVFIV
jgi:hypothetical protein